MDPSRRSLLKGASALTALVATQDAWSRAAPRVELATVSELVPGVPRVFDYPAGHPVVLVRLGRAARDGVGPDRDIVCFSMACTHQGCPVVFRDGRLLCPCHYSQFDPAMGGQCYQGPANDPLPRILLEVHGDTIFATGIEGLVWGHVENPE